MEHSSWRRRRYGWTGRHINCLLIISVSRSFKSGNKIQKFHTIAARFSSRAWSGRARPTMLGTKRATMVDRNNMIRVKRVFSWNLKRSVTFWECAVLGALEVKREDNSFWIVIVGSKNVETWSLARLRKLDRQVSLSISMDDTAHHFNRCRNTCMYTLMKRHTTCGWSSSSSRVEYQGRSTKRSQRSGGISSISMSTAA